MSDQPRQLMAEAWSEFAMRSIKGNVPFHLKKMFRRSFYAGADAVLIKILTELEDGTEETPNDLQLMDNLMNEIRRFGEDIKAGKA